jgi:hypothetical protein
VRVRQHHWSPQQGWLDGVGPLSGASVALAFGAPAVLASDEALAALAAAYPDALRIGCSTAGEVHHTRVLDESLVVTALQFDDVRVRSAAVSLAEVPDSRDVGERLAAALAAPDLSHLLVLSDGLAVNGSELVRGLASALPPGVQITGGLAGDADRFERTLVLHGDAAGPGRVAALGLYGSALVVGCASLGGWSPFGPERRVTRSEGNVLYELDGQSALALYSHYLGEHAAQLPASALRFPLNLRDASRPRPVVRTVLSVDQAEQSMTFAGDIPEGAYVRLMRANLNRLVGGAEDAARTASAGLEDMPPSLALCFSCVGRKMTLRQRVEEELEAVQAVGGPACTVAGFYTYGEIGPFGPASNCELHNQTMTVTFMAERSTL